MQYEIKGAPFPAVICTLNDGEQMITEGGGMSWMSPNMVMETTTNGGKAIGRMFSGDKMFQNRYTCRGGNGLIAFTSCCPGEIRAIEIHPGQEIICQKSAFLASTPGVNMSVYFKKSLSGGLFGGGGFILQKFGIYKGEGFIMQKFDGEGIVFVELDGSVVEYNLAQGQQLVLDTGHLAMMDATCKMDVQTVSGVKNVLFGGEGLFNTVITGPGKVLVQTLPVNKFAIELYKYMPKSSK